MKLHGMCFIPPRGSPVIHMILGNAALKWFPFEDGGFFLKPEELRKKTKSMLLPEFFVWVGIVSVL
jgi:hypothetical protein